MQIWKTNRQTISYLFMDEPRTGLDIHYRQSFLKIAKSLLHEKLILVAVMHDMNLVMKYADKVICLKTGMLAAAGTKDIISEALIENVFDVKTTLIKIRIRILR